MKTPSLNLHLQDIAAHYFFRLTRHFPSSMAINFSDGVILGADSRTTTGAYIANRVTDKLTQVHDTIWCCRSGSAADTQAVADIVHYHLGMYGITNDEPPTTQTAAALFQELCYDNKDMLRSVWRDFILSGERVIPPQYMCIQDFDLRSDRIPQNPIPSLLCLSYDAICSFLRALLSQYSHMTLTNTFFPQRWNDNCRL